MKKHYLLWLAVLASSQAQAQIAFKKPVTYSFEAGAARAIVAHVDTDAHPDIVVAGGASSVAVVLRNDGAGSFLTPQVVATGNYCAAVAVATMDCNSTPDLVTSNALAGTVSIITSVGSTGGKFTGLTTTLTVGGQPVDVLVGATGPRDVAVADLLSGSATWRTRDANQDACGMAYLDAASVDMQAGTFSAGRLRTADLNHDGRPDIVSVNQANGEANGLSVAFGTETGYASPLSFATGDTWASDALLVDLNQDGRADAVVSNANKHNVVVRLGLAEAPWLGEPTTYALPASPLSLAAADMDGDGHVDVVAGFDGGRPQLLRGRADGSLGAAEDLGSIEGPHVLTADFDGDGRMDLATASFGTVQVQLAGTDVLTANAGVAPAAALTVYPNPNQGRFRVGGTARPDQVRVTDVAGRVVVHQLAGDVLTLPTAWPGLYVVELRAGAQVRRARVVVQ